MLFQVLVVYVTIEMNTGNGSWLGLGAFLIGMFTIPATAIVNSIYIRTHREERAITVVMNCFLIAAIMPVLMVIVLMIG